MQAESQPQESLTPQEKNKAWWGGAIENALKGIPQGILLGIGAAFILFGVIAAMTLTGGAIGAFGVWTAHAFGGFVYSQQAVGLLTAAGTSATAVIPIVTSIGNIGLVPIVLFNTVLTAVGNFISGGDMAVAALQQKFDHEVNNQRIRQLEGREYLLEQVVNEKIGNPQAVESILKRGARNVESFVAAQEAQAIAAANQSKTIN